MTALGPCSEGAGFVKYVTGKTGIALSRPTLRGGSFRFTAVGAGRCVVSGGEPMIGSKPGVSPTVKGTSIIGDGDAVASLSGGFLAPVSSSSCYNEARSLNSILGM